MNAMDIIKTIVIVTIAAAAAHGAAWARNGAKASSGPRTVLGFIVPGQTTREDFLAGYNEHFQGCEGSISGEADHLYRVSSGTQCFSGLPGNPSLMVNFGSGVVDVVDLTFEKDFGGSNFDSYVRDIRKKYGKPRKLQRPYVGNCYAEWKTSWGKIIIDAPHMSFKGTLTYMSDSFQNFLDSQEKEKEQEQARAREDLL